MSENNHHAPAGGPPMVFAMPMFRSFVPEPLRPWIYVVLAFCYQLSGGVYLGAMADMVGEHAWMREDVQMCLYATLAGMAFYFPVLFRMKFHFTNRFLLMTSALVILCCNALTMLNLPLPLMWTLCFVCGMAKIQGTFECMSSIQLWMTSKRDMAVFFPLLHLILLTSIEGAGFIAAAFAFYGHWTMMHWFVMSLMLFVLLVQHLLTVPFHAMPKIIPLKGIDWQGALLWALLAMQVAYIFNYGEFLDWWNSPTLRLLTGTSLITLVIALHRMHTATSPYFEPAMWRYPYVLPIILLVGIFEALFVTEHNLETVYYGVVMHYNDLTQETLAQWALPGMWAGCLFALGWLALMRWNPYRLIAIGLLAYVGYAACFYFLLDAGLSIEQLRWPIVMRGFSYAVIAITLMWSLATVMSFQHFFQALSVFNVLHMFIGGVIGGACYSYGLRYYIADGYARSMGAVDAVSVSARPLPFDEFMGHFFQSTTAQGVKILYGWTLYVAIALTIFMLLWDLPAVRRRVHHIPTWPSLGMQVWRGFQRQQKLKRLKRQRLAVDH